MKKKKQNILSGFSSSYQGFDSIDDCFVDILPNCKVARQFDGSFHEFEIKNQGTLFKRWLLSYRYR